MNNNLLNINNSIPLIGILCLINVDLLKRLINNFDYNINTVVII